MHAQTDNIPSPWAPVGAKKQHSPESVVQSLSSKSKVLSLNFWKKGCQYNSIDHHPYV